jgi:hypothetical protein
MRDLIRISSHLWRGMLILCCLLGGHAILAQDAAEPMYTVQNPTGFPPPIARKSMAPRPADLAGKTIYLVDVTFDNGDMLLLEMQKWLTTHRPEIKTEFRVKKGFYAADDPDLWREIKANNGLMIMAIGH